MRYPLRFLVWAFLNCSMAAQCRHGGEPVEKPTSLHALRASVTSEGHLSECARDVERLTRALGRAQNNYEAAKAAVKGGPKARRQSRINTCYRVITSVQAQFKNAQKRRRCAEKTYSEAALTHTQFAKLLPPELWIEGVVPHLNWGEMKVLITAAPALRDVFRDLVGMPEEGLPSFARALTALAETLDESPQRPSLYEARLHQWFQGDATEPRTGFVGVA